MIIWNEQFATGHKTIDKQHQVLFENVNRLESFLDLTNFTRQEIEFILSLIDYLEGYAREHFKLEEQCMESYRCPVYQKNKDAHQHFIVALKDFKEKCRVDGFRPEVLRQLHQFMQNWLQQHILRIDTQLKPSIAAASS